MTSSREYPNSLSTWPLTSTMRPWSSTMIMPVGAASMASRNCSVARRCSVMSRVTLPYPTSRPAGSRKAVITTWAQKRDPSFRTLQPFSSKRPALSAITSARRCLAASMSWGT